jgi:hypothetical protein
MDNVLDLQTVQKIKGMIKKYGDVISASPGMYRVIEFDGDSYFHPVAEYSNLKEALLVAQGGTRIAWNRRVQLNSHLEPDKLVEGRPFYRVYDDQGKIMGGDSIDAYID